MEHDLLASLGVVVEAPPSTCSSQRDNDISRLFSPTKRPPRTTPIHKLGWKPPALMAYVERKEVAVPHWRKQPAGFKVRSSENVKGLLMNYGKSRAELHHERERCRVPVEENQGLGKSVPPKAKEEVEEQFIVSNDELGKKREEDVNAPSLKEEEPSMPQEEEPSMPQEEEPSMPQEDDDVEPRESPIVVEHERGDQLLGKEEEEMSQMTESEVILGYLIGDSKKSRQQEDEDLGTTLHWVTTDDYVEEAAAVWKNELSSALEMQIEEKCQRQSRERAARMREERMELQRIADEIRKERQEITRVVQQRKEEMLRSGAEAVEERRRRKQQEIEEARELERKNTIDAAEKFAREDAIRREQRLLHIQAAHDQIANQVKERARAQRRRQRKKK